MGRGQYWAEGLPELSVKCSGRILGEKGWSYMNSENKKEMEQIQRGLEAFLEQEMNMGHEDKMPEKPQNITRQKSLGTEETKPQRAQNATEEPQIIHKGTTLDEASDEGWYHESEENTSEDGKKEISDMHEEKDVLSEGEFDMKEDQVSDYEDWDRERGYTKKRTRKESRKGQTQVRGKEEKAESSKPKRSVKAGKEDSPMKNKKSSEKKSDKQPRKKKHRFRRFVIVTVLLIGALGIGLYQLVGVVYNKMNYKEIVSVTDLPMQEEGVVNILLIGNDSRENGEDGRSDAMILLSVSKKTKTIYMTSLLRDMYVEIPGHDGNRLNAAYAFGGAELLMETIEHNFGIPVNRYVLVNFEAFANLVDAVGGIELELTSEEIVYVNGYLVEYNMLTGRPQGTDNMDTSVSGLVHLNGPQALAYSRNRYLGTDFGRTERQRKVLTAVIKKLPTSLLTNGGELMDGLLPNLTTNLTQNEIFRLSLMAGKLLTYDIVSDNIPQPGTYQDVIIRKMEVLQVDFDANIQYLKEKLYGEEWGSL